MKSQSVAYLCLNILFKLDEIVIANENKYRKCNINSDGKLICAPISVNLFSSNKKCSRKKN